MKRIDQFEKPINILLEGITTFFFFVIVIMTILLVILRYVFNKTIIGGNEAIQFLFIYTTAFGAAVSLGKRQHIKISVFIEKLTPNTRKIVNIFNSLLIILLNIYIVLQSIKWISSVGYFETPVLSIPQGIVQICIPVSCGFIVLYSLKHIISEFFFANE